MDLDEILEIFEQLRDEQTAAINNAIKFCIKLHSRNDQISSATENSAMSFDLSNQQGTTNNVKTLTTDAASPEFTSMLNDNNFHSTSKDDASTSKSPQSFVHVSTADVAQFPSGAEKREAPKMSTQSTSSAIEPMLNTQKRMSISVDIIQKRSVGQANNFSCEENRDKITETDQSEDYDDDDTGTNVNICTKKPMKVNETKRIPERFVCDAVNCESVFTTKKSLDKHKATHKDRKLHQCNTCNKSFGYKYNLVQHLKIHTGEKPYKCMVCEKSFTQAAHLSNHLRIHTGEKPFNCSVCEKSFTDASNLSSHLRIHTGEKPFNCSVCQKSFTQTGSLSRHLRIHTDDNPFNCSVCQKSFTQAGSLSNHLRIHTGEKPYNCTICQKSFRTSSNLSSHLRIHTGGKRHTCNKSFLYKCNLSAHIKTYHDNNTTLKGISNFIAFYVTKLKM